VIFADNHELILRFGLYKIDRNQQICPAIWPGIATIAAATAAVTAWSGQKVWVRMGRGSSTRRFYGWI